MFRGLVDKLWALSGYEKPPEIYRDGCTMFWQKFGGISHKHICDAHDIRYWNERTFVKKVEADWMWFVGINKVHWRGNTVFWAVIATGASVFGLIGLLTYGSYLWAGAHRFRVDDNDDA